MLLSGEEVLLKDRNLVHVLRGHKAAQGLMVNGRKLCQDFNFSPHISFDSPAEFRKSTISSSVWATRRKPTVYSLFFFPHTHTHTCIHKHLFASFICSECLIFIYISPSYAAACLHLFLLTYLLSFLSALTCIYGLIYSPLCSLADPLLKTI